MNNLSNIQLNMKSNHNIAAAARVVETSRNMDGSLLDVLSQDQFSFKSTLKKKNGWNIDEIVLNSLEQQPIYVNQGDEILSNQKMSF